MDAIEGPLLRAIIPENHFHVVIARVRYHLILLTYRLPSKQDA